VKGPAVSGEDFWTRTLRSAGGPPRHPPRSGWFRSVPGSSDRQRTLLCHRVHDRKPRRRKNPVHASFADGVASTVTRMARKMNRLHRRLDRIRPSETACEYW